MKTLALTLMLFATTLAGCSEEKAKSVDWYETHSKERIAKLNECAQKETISQDCKNAQLATHNNSAETPVTDW
mgnify:CR=1 FL=1